MKSHDPSARANGFLTLAGGIWKVILNINGAVQAIGLALLVLFFLVGMAGTSASLDEVKRPEHALKLFIRFGNPFSEMEGNVITVDYMKSQKVVR